MVKVDLWAKDGRMIIALEMTGSLNGTIYLSGIPNYNTTTKEIYFDQTLSSQFSIKIKN